MDLVSVYRDAIAVSVGASGALVNEELRRDVELLARVSTPEAHLRRISAVFEAREQMLEFNVPPMLALESMMLALVAPGGARRVKQVVAVILIVAPGAGCRRQCRPGAGRRRRPRRLDQRPARRAHHQSRDPVPPIRRAPTLAPFYAQTLDWGVCRGDFLCATLTVPLDYADAGRRDHRPRAAQAARAVPSTRIGSLVVNPGGPGAPGTDYAAYASAGLPPTPPRPLRRRRLRPARHRRQRRPSTAWATTSSTPSSPATPTRTRPPR